MRRTAAEIEAERFEVEMRARAFAIIYPWMSTAEAVRTAERFVRATRG